MSFVPQRERITLRECDQVVVDALAASLKVSPLVSRLLVCRGLTTFDQCERFFNPAIDQLLDPFLFRDMEAAVDRIGVALSQGEKIVVYGDYDADGVTSVAVLVRLLREFGASVEYYLPNRLSEGYGMSSEAVEVIADSGARLIVSVDCGIGAADEVAVARARGVDVIITDHHEPHGALPDAVAVLNPRVETCGYPDRNLAGVGVALKLCQALCARLTADAPHWQDLLDLVSLGTSADIVPLRGENRVIVAEGLKRIGHSRWAGIRALIREQGLESADLSTHHVVFQLAPCINAVGRLGDARRAVDLLLTNDESTATALARELVQANKDRRALHEQVELEAIAWVEAHCDPESDMGIVAASPHWHQGVVGIVASKLVERFNRPALLFSVSEGIAHGSGRTAGGLHLLDALGDCAGVLDRFGGHAAAAGMTLQAGKVDELRVLFNRAVRARVTPDDLRPTVFADAEIRVGELSPKLFKILERMRPFGPGNMRPVLVSRGLRNARDPRIVGARHLKLSVRDADTVIDAIGFGFGERLPDVRAGQGYSLAFCLDENEYNGRTSLQMVIKGVEA